MTERAIRLVSSDELAEVDQPETLVAEAVSAFLQVRRRPDVAALLDAADCLYEVPFSLPSSGDGTDRGVLILRGTIDCLARLPDGRVMVVEIKTGQPRHWHQDQLQSYVFAARAMLPGREVDGLVLYA